MRKIKMLLNIEKAIEKAKSTAHALVEEVLANNPELLVWAAKKDYKSIQFFLEENFSKEEKTDWVIRNLFEENEGAKEVIESVCADSGLDLKITKKFLALMALHRRVNVNSMANMLKHNFETPSELQEFLEKALECEFMSLDESRKQYVVSEMSFLQLTSDQENHLDCLQSRPPMICSPNKIRKLKNGNHANGYLKIKSTCFTKRADVHPDIPVQWLNKFNHTKYRLNYKWWMRHGINNPHIPEREVGEGDSDYNKKITQAIRVHMKKCFYMELYFKLGIKNIWILKEFDYRGRVYTISTLFNPQGTDADKAILCLEPEEITMQGLFWLKISIANCMNSKYKDKDLDKHEYGTRLEWFNEVMNPIMELNSTEFYSKLDEMAKEAESPCCFFSQVQNFKHIYDAMKRGGKPMCWSICHFDATASGYQIQAILARDMGMAKLTNLIGNTRNDVYTSIYEGLILKGLPSTYTRNQLKKGCLIPTIYGSVLAVQETFPLEAHQKIFHEYMDQFPMWKLNMNFPNLWDKQAKTYSWDMPDGFKVHHVIRPKKRKGQKNKDIVYIQWIISGITVELEFIEDKPLNFSLEFGPNMTHAADGLFVREIDRRMNFGPEQVDWVCYLMTHKELWKPEEDKTGSRARMEYILKCREKTQFDSMAILTEMTPHNVDLIPQEVAAKLIKSLPNVQGSITAIHDSFGVHPNNASALVGQYKYLLCELLRSRYLSSVVEDFTRVETGTYEEDPYEESFCDAIMNSIYPLC